MRRYLRDGCALANAATCRADIPLPLRLLLTNAPAHAFLFGLYYLDRFAYYR